MNAKTKHILMTILITIFLGITGYTAVRDNTKAKHLKQVCTETTIGRYRGTSYTKITSKHLKAYYIINNVQYDTLGMYHGENGFDVKIHYNPNNVAESYCGEEPVRTGFIEATVIAMESVCFIVLIEGLVKKKYLYT